MASTLLEMFKQGFGIRKPQSLKLNRDPLKDSIGSLLKFSNEDELPVLLNRHVVEQKNGNPQKIGLPDIIAYLQPEAERSIQLVQDAERAKSLIPMIAQAEKILVSSIMSPNDLQEADPIYEIDSMPQLPESVVSEIVDYLKERFTNEYKLGEKMEHWTKEALFRSGAAVMLTLPEATLTRLAKSVRQDDKERSGYEALEYYCSEENYQNLLNTKVYTKSNNSNNYSSNRLNQPSINLDNNRNTQLIDFKNRYESELKAGIESIYFQDQNLANITKSDPRYSAISKIQQSLEAMTATIVTKIEEGDVIKISENPEVLRFGKAVRNYEKTKLGKDFDKLWEDTHKKMGLGRVTNLLQEEVLDLTNYLYPEDQNKSLPFNIEIPAEAVIPVCVPGQVEEKLGYFVLIDAHGRPIRASQYLANGGGCTISSRIGNAYASMYGQVPTKGGIQSPIAAYLQRPGMVLNPSEDAMNNIFNYILDNILRRKLQDVGLSEVTFDKYETIATCMLYRMLENKQTTLVFVPEALITYIAFDYRENGCGKSLLENSAFILSLITTLLVTDIMAMMKNAVAKQEITVTFDEEETNQDQVIEQIRNIAIQKSQLNLTSNPTDIARNVTDQSISIKAVKHPNAPGFDIERTYKTDEMPKADTDLLERLESWLTNVFGIPHSVFNQLDDAEFSRSVATSNLFYSQLIRSYQKILCKFVTRFVKVNLKYSPTMQEGLAKILDNHINGKHTNKVQSPIGDDGGKDIKGENLDIKKTLTEVINHITVSLAPPNIAPNKAQYELVSDMTNTISGIVDNLYPNELIHSDDSDASSGLNILKSFIRADIAKHLLKHIGLDAGLEIKELDEFYINNREAMVALSRLSRNFNHDIVLDKTAQTTEQAQETGEDEFNTGNNENMEEDYGTMNEEGNSGEGGTSDEAGGNNDDFNFSF